jgi:hypothetical protein
MNKFLTTFAHKATFFNVTLRLTILIAALAALSLSPDCTTVSPIVFICRSTS